MGGKKKASGDASKGEKVFKNLCAVCHSLSVSAAHRTAHSVSPGTLDGPRAGWRCWISHRFADWIRLLVISPRSGVALTLRFACRSALSSKATQKWTDATLDKWIKSPADFAPGTSA